MSVFVSYALNVLGLSTGDTLNCYIYNQYCLFVYGRTSG